MGLSTSMWTGVAGLLTHGEKMNVLGNNLANVNTVGFKYQRMDFEDMFYTEIGTAGGIGQIGTGVKVGGLFSIMTQGGFEDTGEATDLAISGSGFFTVKSAQGANYYTRAGNFRFDKNGYLVDPNGNVVQGWQVDQAHLASAELNGENLVRVPTMGSLTDIRLDLLDVKAKATNVMTVIANLDASTAQRNQNLTVDATGNFVIDDGVNPAVQATPEEIFTTYTAYNSQKTDDEPALSENAYDYQTTMKIYDELGGAHDATVYYTKITSAEGKGYWEYIVTVPPEEDGRTLDNQTMQSTDKSGVLMVGTMTFSPGGSLENITAFVLDGTSTTTAGPPPTYGLDQWKQAALDDNGMPKFTANFLGVENANFVGDVNAIPVSLNLGISSGDYSWAVGSAANAAGVTGTALASAMSAPNIDTMTTSQLNTQAWTKFISQDGYPPGTLSTVYVDSNGVLTGRYSNGQIRELFVVALADFTNPWGLHREGSNLFSESSESGQPRIDQANSGRLGSVNSTKLETSNVDMAREMVQMILTQRGFQANSKVITTADTMLAEVIQLKR